MNKLQRVARRALAPAGVIEFDPASEAAAQPASEAGYDETSIAERLAAEARIVRRDVVAANGRTLFVYDRR